MDAQERAEWGWRGAQGSHPGHPATSSTCLLMVTEWLLAIQTSHPYSRQKEERELLVALTTAIVTVPEDIRRTSDVRSS